MTDIELRSLLPQHKSDSERANALIALGYPAIAPVLPDLLEWLQDCNWPISHAIAPFLASIGEPMVPLVRRVLQGNDDTWKYWCMERLIKEFPREVAERLRPELERLASNATTAERSESLDTLASDMLRSLSGDREYPSN